MWESICFENKDQILKVLTSLEEVIGEVKKELTADDHSKVHNFFNEARMYRDSFSNITPGSFVKRYEIMIDVVDKPGSIAIIAVLLSSHNINIKNMSIVNNRERENGVLYVSFDSEEQRIKSINLLKELNYEVQIKDWLGGVFMIKTITKAENLKGVITVPGDKSISHRSVMLGALSKGTTHVSGFLTGEDCLSTVSCFREMKL